LEKAGELGVMAVQAASSISGGELFSQAVQEAEALVGGYSNALAGFREAFRSGSGLCPTNLLSKRD